MSKPLSEQFVFFMAATNRPDFLDPALTPVDVSDKEGCTSILKEHTCGKKLASSLNLLVIAANTSGLSGAQLED